MKSVISLYTYLGIGTILQLWDISKFFDCENLRDALGSVYQCGVQGNLYKLLYELNKDTKISVKLSSGLSDERSIGENVTQGSIGGGLISANNLDRGINDQFKGSSHEICYGTLRMQPLCFQDDLARMCTSRDSAQAGNIRVSETLDSKLLDANTDKSVYIIIGPKSKTKKIRSDIETNPLTLGNTELKEKQSDKYLGDLIHQDGLSKSVYATIKAREGRIKAAIFELRSIIEDCRLQTVGGTLSGLEIWELAIIPAILTNSETWVEIGKDSIETLDCLQNLMFTCLFNVPKTSPRIMLNWDLGAMKMKNRIIIRKLTFFNHLNNLSENDLGKEMLQIQLKYNYPGLARECMTYINELKLPNITEEKVSQIKWKRLVKLAVRDLNQRELRQEIQGSKKGKEFSHEEFEIKEYLKTLNLQDARTIFKKRSKMMQFVKMNFPNDINYRKELWMCSSCQSAIDTQSHVIWCSAYSKLRENRTLTSDKDLAKYLQEVLKIRSDLDILK